MPDDVRRSSRVNKGMTPARYSPYTVGRTGPTHTAATITDTSDDDMNSTIVTPDHQRWQTPVSSSYTSTRSSMTSEIQQLTSETPMHVGPPRPIAVPPLDPPQDHLLGGPSGPSTSRTMPQPICQHPDVMPLTSLSAVPEFMLSGPTMPTGHDVDTVPPQSEPQRTTDSLPPFNQIKDHPARSLNGLPPITPTLQSGCQRPVHTQSSITSAQIHRLTGTQSSLPKGWDTREHALNRLNQEIEIMTQMHELSKKLAQMRAGNSDCGSRHSSDFNAFAPISGGDHRTSTRSDSEPQTGAATTTTMVRADIHTAPTPTASHSHWPHASIEPVAQQRAQIQPKASTQLDNVLVTPQPASASQPYGPRMPLRSNIATAVQFDRGQHTQLKVQPLIPAPIEADPVQSHPTAHNYLMWPQSAPVHMVGAAAPTFLPAEQAHAMPAVNPFSQPAFGQSAHAAYFAAATLAGEAMPGHADRRYSARTNDVGATEGPYDYGPRQYIPTLQQRGAAHVPHVPTLTYRDAPVHRGAYERRVMELPQFSGAPEDWPQFICAYETTSREYGYTNLENMGRIQRALTGEAKRRLKGILIRPENVERSVAILTKAFGRPHILAESQIREIRKIPKIAENRLNDIVSYSISVESLVSLLDAPDTEHLLSDYLLLKELTAKLPLTDQRVWAAVSRHIGPNPTIRDFSEWLSNVADDIANIRDDVTEGPSQRSRESKAPPSGSRHVLLNVSNPSSTHSTCAFCGESHDIQSCNAFIKLHVGERLAEVRKRPLCYYCLRPDHLLPACEMMKACGIDGCKRRHHELLHEPVVRKQPLQKHQTTVDSRRPESPRPTPVAEKQRRRPKRQPLQQSTDTPADVSPTPSLEPGPEADTAQPSTVLSCQGSRRRQSVYYRVVPVIVYGPSRKISTYALFDEGSSVSLIDADLAEMLQLSGEARKLNLQFVNGASSTLVSRNVAFGISGVGIDDVRYDIDTVQTATDISLPTQTVDRDDVLERNPHLADVPFETYDNVRPTILLGLEHHFLGVPLITRMGKDIQSIAAAHTRLGWVLYGSVKSSLPGAVILHARQIASDDDANATQLQQLHDVVRRHFTTEDFGVKAPTKPIQSDEDERAITILETTTKRIGGRFETGLLWKQDDIIHPDSYAMAAHRLRTVEAKMRRDPEYAQQYIDQIQSYLDKGYAREMTAVEANRRGPRTWYLPHFAVRNANKPGKFRLVFDAAATTHNVSLNSMLLPGPDLNVPLTRLLFRFRLGIVGVCADIREMFHQVAIRREDQDAQRFLWRGGDSTVEPRTYVMIAMTFGSTCSPSSAQFVKNLNAKEYAKQYPEAAAAIQRSHYVDDYVASFRTTADAQRITSDVISLHKRGGFELRGFTSNCPEFRARFGSGPDSIRSISLEPEDLTQKILGMTWETEHDSFSFATRFHRVHPGVMDGSRIPTKREILSVVMSIFDPFGLLADFLLPSKVIIQDLWRLGVQWDEPLPEQINERWQGWRKEVEKTRHVRIARCYSPSILAASGLQLHVFADASEEAYAAVAYWRINGTDGVELSFVAGKVRCAPLKILTIPRLELQAAVLATRLMTEIRTSHECLDISRTAIWSDSETVLKWLRCDQRRYVQFVAHRVAEIVETAPAELWHYVPTAQNVADDATRVRTPINFDPKSRWLHGPAWLRGEESNWPAQPDFANPASVEVEDLRPRFVGLVQRRGAVDYERFSKLNRLVRCVGWIRRFIQNARGGRVCSELTAEEVNGATLAICRWVQEESFAEEVADLRTGKQICKHSRLFLLKPYMDDGLLRVHGRTDAAKDDIMPIAMKRPIIMPRDHRVTMLIVRQHHVQHAHQLTDATIASVRQNYWVPQIRLLVKSVQNACQTCRIRSARPNPPSQGQLPADRLEAYARPFTYTGLDFFGPYDVTIGRRREKRWVALFTCMVVRAVHLEVAADLSTDACLLCIRNFCHLRGVPARIRCDNGTNFVGAKNELERHPDFFDSDEIQREMAGKGVEWIFNCPSNPEAGGAWERLVQAVKRVLRVVLLEEAPRVETLRSLLLEAANVVNSRPLTHLQVDPDDPDPLTPNHFLIGGPNVATAPNPDDVEPTATRRQWQICRGLSRRFWSQFIRDFLPELTRRSKHYKDQPQLKVGDVVIICDEQQPKGRWTRGVVLEAVTAADGVVRTARVQTSTGIYRRPATRLAKLDVGPAGGVDGRGAVSQTGADRS